MLISLHFCEGFPRKSTLSGEPQNCNFPLFTTSTLKGKKESIIIWIDGLLSNVAQLKSVRLQ